MVPVSYFEKPTEQIMKIVSPFTVLVLKRGKFTIIKFHHNFCTNMHCKKVPYFLQVMRGCVRLVQNPVYTVTISNTGA